MKKNQNELKASRKYNEENREIINIKSRINTLKNKDKVLENRRKYRERNRAKINAQALKRYHLRKEEAALLKNEEYEKEGINKKMFGKQKPVEAKKKAAVEEATPDLVVPVAPKNMGMPGFTADPEPLPQTPAAKEEATVTAAVAAPAVVAPTPEPEPATAVREQYQVAGAEMMPDGLFRYIIITNKNLGQVGGVYDI